MRTSHRSVRPVSSGPMIARTAAAVLVLPLLPLPAQGPDFEREVLPLLADRCFACHGPDAAQREAGLRLDREEESRVVLPSGRRAIVPGEPAKSELVRRIRSEDPGEQMPPPSSGVELSAQERAVLESWVASGARFEQHWAFSQLPSRITVPEVEHESWVRDPLDRFVLAGLEEASLRPTPAAGRDRWLRRVTLTLTGLPPSPEERSGFLADRVEGAEERVVDRLLASDAYAERMAVDWLDAARYADTYGYQSDVHREVWPWRDWVLRAFADNLPYDQFLTWQLAGDLLPDATRDQRLATAFLRLHRQTNEGGSVDEEYRVENVADRVETVGTAVLGLTLGCAKCHDHKFDPISQRDYFGLFALFDGCDEAGLYSHFTSAVPTPTLLLPTPDQERARAAAELAVEQAERELEERRAALQGDFDAWLDAHAFDAPLPGLRGAFDFDGMGSKGELSNAVADGAAGSAQGQRPAVVEGARGEALALSGEDALVFPKVGDFTRNDPFTISLYVRPAEHHERAVIWHRSRAWTDAGSRGFELLLEDGRPSAALIHFWPGNAIRVLAREPLPVGSFSHVAVTYDGSSRADGLGILVDGRPVEVDVVRDKLRKNITGGGASALTIGQRFRDNGLRGGVVDELRVFGRALAPLEVEELVRPGTLREVAQDPSRRAELRAVYAAAFDPGMRSIREALLAARRARSAAIDPVREIMTMRDDGPEDRVAHVLARGAYDARREAVAPGTPSSLPPWPADHERDRLGFARWLIEPSHPLTARVAVNRVWQMHFGRGLCATPEDLGTQGARPAQGDLLDHLARRFVDGGWDIKALHRAIVLSATFAQDSACDASLRDHDPYNELLGRGPSFRLSAEMVRDQALAASGLLVDRVGGPSVRPYQPPGLWREKSGATYTADKGEGLWRRSLYTYWKRTSPPPAMMTFDASAREVCSVRREATTNPLQALVLMNDPQHVEAARVLAERLVVEAPGPGGRVDRLFQIVLGRPAEEAERRLLGDRVEEERARFAGDPAAAAALVAVGTAPRNESIAAADVAAWTVAVSVVLCCDEAIMLR
jgi:mono/diheme cytochrome c family protein